MSTPDRGCELIQKYLEGLTSAEEQAELEHLLVADPVVADAFAEAARLHASLEGYFLKQYKMDQIAALLNTPDPLSQPSGRVVGDRQKPATTGDASAGSGSTFIAGNAHPTAIHAADDRRPWKFSAKRLNLKWIVAALLLLGMGMTIWSTKRADVRHARLISGRVNVAGHEVTQIPHNLMFEVVGDAVAVIEIPSGAQIELIAETRAIIRQEQNQSVVELITGGGDFSIESEQAAFRVETPLGVVTTAGGRFSLDVVTTLPGQFVPTVPVRLPQLVVAVAEGSVVVAHAGVSTTLSTGDKQVFFNQT